MLETLEWSSSIKEKAKRVFTLAVKIISDCKPRYVESVDLRRFHVEFDHERLNVVRRSDGGDERATKVEARRRGRQQKYDPDKDRRLAEDWEASSIRTYKEFAAERGISEKEVCNAVNRNQKRRKKATE